MDKSTRPEQPTQGSTPRETDLLLPAASTLNARIDDLNRHSERVVFQDAQQALAFSLEAVALAREARDDRQLAQSALRLGTAASVSGDEQAALLAVAEALTLFQTLGDAQGVAGSFLSLSTITRNMGQLIDGLQHALSGLQTARAHALPRLESACLNNVGLLYTDLGDHHKALEAFREALPLTRTAGSASDEGLCLTNLGDVCTEAGQAGQALNYYQEALAIHQRLNDTHRKIDTLCGLGNAYLLLGQTEQAIGVFQQALRASQAANDHKSDARLYIGLGRALALKRQAAQAAAVYARAQQLAHQTQARHEETLAWRHLGTLHLHQGELVLAQQTLQEALTLAEQSQASREQQETHALLSQVHEQRGDHRAALKHYQRFHQLERDLNTQQATHRTQALMLHVQIEQARQAAETQSQINARLTEINAQLEVANAQKAELLERLQEQAKHLVRLSQEDALTGLFNRRHFNEQFEQEAERSARYGRPLSLVLLDIDHFKQVNDTFSHQVGDQVLRTLAGLLCLGCRQTDTLARFGGEEFVLLLPETPLEGALPVCERLRQMVETHDWEAVQPGLRVTISLGVAGGPLGTSQLLAAADEQLYRAKRAGRNRVCIGPTGADQGGTVIRE